MHRVDVAMNCSQRLAFIFLFTDCRSCLRCDLEDVLRGRPVDYEAVVRKVYGVLKFPLSTSGPATPNEDRAFPDFFSFLLETLHFEENFMITYRRSWHCHSCGIQLVRLEKSCEHLVCVAEVQFRESLEKALVVKEKLCAACGARMAGEQAIVDSGDYLLVTIVR